MTDKIVDLDAQRPHVAGPVLCLRCEHEWVAVRPVGTHPMECPKCQGHGGLRVEQRPTAASGRCWARNAAVQR